MSFQSKLTKPAFSYVFSKLYSGQYIYNNFDSKPYAIRFGTYNKPLLHNHNYIDLNCFCHKPHVLNEINGFDENLDRLIDWDFILKISNIFKIYSIPVILSKYYNHDSANRITNKPFDYFESSKKIIALSLFCSKVFIKFKFGSFCKSLNFKSFK